MTLRDESEIPRPVGHVVSVMGDSLTVYPNPFGAGEVAFRSDDGAGPYNKIAGCPNCGKYAGEWWDGITYAASLNSGRDPNEPCSQVCRYQLEWQTEVAASRMTEAAWLEGRGGQ